MKRRCVNYVGLACVDGSCAAQDEYRNLKMDDCENCFYYKGCKDCAVSDTKYCKEEFYHGPEE